MIEKESESLKNNMLHSPETIFMAAIAIALSISRFLASLMQRKTEGFACITDVAAVGGRFEVPGLAAEVAGLEVRPPAEVDINNCERMHDI